MSESRSIRFTGWSRSLILLAGFLTFPCTAQSDSFDAYDNKSLARLIESKHVREVKKLTPNLVIEHDRVLPGIRSAFLVVKTNAGRHAKLLVQSGKQRTDKDRAVPILSIERFVTFKEGEEQTRLVTGKEQSLFENFRFSLDLGQVVPEEITADLRFVVDKESAYAEPVGKARLYVVTRHDPIKVSTTKKFVLGPRFVPEYFNGTYLLRDDGRRTGKLILKVESSQVVSGFYYSDKDGSKYEVFGRISNPTHLIEFTIKYPRTEQKFRGMLFTGDGQAIAGTSKMIDRETAFYATRLK